MALALLATLVAACTSVPPPKAPAADVDPSSARALARDAADVLLELSAYDYALAGTLSGERRNAVDRARYATVARSAAESLQRFASGALTTTIDSEGRISDHIVTLADELIELSRDATAYADGGDPARFASLTTRVTRAWDGLAQLARLLKPLDEGLAATIARGLSITVGVAVDRKLVLTVGPFAAAEDARAVAEAIGAVESVSGDAPFVVRVGTFTDQAAADAATKAVSDKGYTGLVTPEDHYRFSRGQVVPQAELWREPERVQSTQAGARRVAVAVGATYVASGADDGSVAIFDGDGKLVSLPRFNAGVSLLAFSEDARFLMGGARTLANFLLPQGLPVGTQVRLPVQASQLVFVPRANYFAASAAAAEGGQGGVVAGRAPDGQPLLSFPIGTPARGAALAATRSGELYIATDSGGGKTDVEVLDLTRDRTMRGVLHAPGSFRALAIDPGGVLGAVMTDQGVFRFGPRDSDPAGTLTRISDPVADLAFGYDGTLYLLTKTQLSAHDLRGELLWKTALVDARRLVIAKRPLVLDAAGHVFAFDRKGTTWDLGVTGNVLDVSASADGERVAVLVDTERALIFKLP